MKQFTAILLATLLFTQNVYAQLPWRKKPGKAASASVYDANKFAWGIGLGGLIVLGTVVGFTVGAASSCPSTYNDSSSPGSGGGGNNTH